MATFDYANARSVADNLITKFGQTGTVTTPGTKTGDAWNPSIGAAGTETCTLVELDFAESEIDGTLVLRTDKKVYVRAGGLSAEFMNAATKLTYGGVDHQIIKPVKPFAPGGTVLLWELQVRV